MNTLELTPDYFAPLVAYLRKPGDLQTSLGRRMDELEHSLTALSFIEKARQGVLVRDDQSLVYTWFQSFTDDALRASGERFVVAQSVTFTLTDGDSSSEMAVSYQWRVLDAFDVTELGERDEALPLHDRQAVSGFKAYEFGQDSTAAMALLELPVGQDWTASLDGFFAPQASIWEVQVDFHALVGVIRHRVGLSGSSQLETRDVTTALKLSLDTPQAYVGLYALMAQFSSVAVDFGLGLDVERQQGGIMLEVDGSASITQAIEACMLDEQDPVGRVAAQWVGAWDLGRQRMGLSLQLVVRIATNPEPLVYDIPLGVHPLSKASLHNRERLQGWMLDAAHHIKESALHTLASMSLASMTP